MSAGPYVPKLRRNDMRRHLDGELKTTTVELPIPLMDRAKQYARENRMPLRSLFHYAIAEYIGQEGGR